MMRVTIELLPKGDETRIRKLGEILIANDGSEKAASRFGTYDIVLKKSGEYSRTAGVWKRGRVEHFPRVGRGPYDLLLRGLQNTIGDRNR